MTDDPAPAPAPTPPAPERLPFGRAPRPVEGADVAARLRSAILAELPAGAELDLTCDARLDGPAITDLDLRVDRLRAPLDDAALEAAVAADAAAAAQAGAAPPERAPEPAAREAGIIGRGRVTVDDARVGPLPFEARADLRDVPFEWVTEADGSLTIGEVDVVPPGRRPYLEVQARAGTDDVTAAAGEFLRLGLRQARMRLVSFSLALRQAAADGPVHVELAARIGKGPFTASARAVGEATLVGSPPALDLDGVRVTSANPLVALVLLWLRGRIREAVANPVPLDTGPGGAIPLRDARVRVTDTIVLALRFGDGERPPGAADGTAERARG